MFATLMANVAPNRHYASCNAYNRAAVTLATSLQT